MLERFLAAAPAEALMVIGRYGQAELREALQQAAERYFRRRRLLEAVRAVDRLQVPDDVCVGTLRAALQDYFERNGVNELPEAGEVLELVRAERAARYAEAHDSIAQLDADVWRRRLLDAID